MGTNKYQYQGVYGVPKPGHKVATHVGGVCMCILSAAIAFTGTKAAVDALSRTSDDSVNLTRQQYAAESTIDDTDNEYTAQPLTSVPAQAIITYDYTTDQLTWAHEHHIHWNADGNPVNEYGIIEDDPTTDVNELLRAVANGTADEDGKAVEGGQKKPEPEKEEDEKPAEETEPETEAQQENPYEGIDGVSQLADGTYIYTVKTGDTLCAIASKFGTTVDELVKLNGIKNPDCITTGQQIILPACGVTVNSTGAGLG